MTKEQIVGLAVRLFAIFLALYTIREIAILISFTTAPPPTGFIVVAGGMILLQSVVALLLWFFPLTVAGNLIPSIKPERKAGKLGADGIEVVAFTVMGLWVLASAIPDLFYWATYAYRVKTMGIGRPVLSPENMGHMVTTVVELAIGFWLLFGSKGLIGIIRRARQAGT